MIRDINLIGFNIFFLLDLYFKKSKKKLKLAGPWPNVFSHWKAQSHRWAFKPKSIGLGLVLFFIFKGVDDMSFASILLREKGNKTSPIKVDDVLFASPYFGYCNNGWKIMSTLFFCQENYFLIHFNSKTHLTNTLRTLTNNPSTQNTQKRSKNMKLNRASFGFLGLDLFFQTTLLLKNSPSNPSHRIKPVDTKKNYFSG